MRGIWSIFWLIGLSLFLSGTGFLGGASRAAEPWADSQLPVDTGLALWLDASRLDKMPEGSAPGDEPPVDGGELEWWRDGSGQGRDVRQALAAARPKTVRVGSDWVVRFDGEDDCLRREQLGGELAECTVFVVAAPHDNPGGFRGLVALNRHGERDYESGLNIDLGPDPSLDWRAINVEGRGFGGWRNLLTGQRPLGELHTLATVVAAEPARVRLWFDGAPAGERPWTAGALPLDEVTVGARFYQHGAGQQRPAGFLPGDIAEVLIYDRALTDDELRAVSEYLNKKHARLAAVLPSAVPRRAGPGEPLVTVADPPPVQWLLPGFSVRRLPIDLPNVNNLRYRDDGKLLALTYGGALHLLSDTDGDGIEDRAELFWDGQGKLVGAIGMAIAPKGSPHAGSVFVASKGKVSMIVDDDGDHRADREQVVAEGWPQSTANVDAVGVTVDDAGRVYFGLGCADYTNAYLIDAQGQSRYDLQSERGTIQAISPDLQSRETVVTGIRFPIGIAFNEAGDLFCTDQEGATWLPNGNPFDELLHIERGRHYGFPPRHPKHLPRVIDEPSVYDYGPQHQSTCGLTFNQGGDTQFGPANWRGDALVAAYSRGKLYRTKLVKTRAGYVARNQLLACLAELTVDVCVSPRGDLLIATHSGGPDWGSGPSGAGKLYLVRYDGDEQPQPVAIWPTGPHEVCVAFDRPLDPARLAGLAGAARITYGEHVRAADRFETLRPGYEVVYRQMRAGRFPLAVASAQVTPDGRALLLGTARHERAAHYALELPGMGRPTEFAAGELPQHAAIDLDFDLGGTSVHWSGGDAGATWSGWLPHLDLAVSRALVAGSAAHDALWPLLTQQGTLRLTTQLDLTDMLRPAVQPGSTIDYEWPAEQVTIELVASAPFEVSLGEQMISSAADDKGQQRAELKVAPARGEWTALEVTMSTGGAAPNLELKWRTSEDARPRALPLRRFFLPWARPAGKEQDTQTKELPPELAGGSWARGRKVFFGADAGCAKCHALHGEGGRVGPDLSNLMHRDYASVLRDITNPSFAINPDYISYVAELKDGRVLTGPVRTQGDTLLFGDAEGRVTETPRDAIESMAAATRSIMPEGLPKQLGADRIRDLLTYLLTEPPHMPRDDASPGVARSRQEIAAALAGAPAPPERTRPLRIVLVAGPKDHGPGEHDYPAWQKSWAELLSAASETTVEMAWQWPSAEQLASADVLVLYQHGGWQADRAAEVDAFLARGGGLALIHYAVDGGADPAGLAERVGLAWQAGASKFRHGALELRFAPGHPITRNLGVSRFHDESYWGLARGGNDVRVLASGVEDGAEQPLFWVAERSRGRAFVSILGHYSKTFDDPLFRIVLLRGIAWAAGEPVDRFNVLVLPGARVGS